MRWLALMTLALSVASCRGDGLSEPTNVVSFSTVAGTWTLRTIGGAGLPFVLDQAGADKIELINAAIVATANGGFTATSTERTTISGQATSQSYSDGGSFIVTGTSVIFTFSSDGASATGALLGDSLTFTGNGVPIVYRRQ
jgi:hypothetical protein